MFHCLAVPFLLLDVVDCQMAVVVFEFEAIGSEMDW